MPHTLEFQFQMGSLAPVVAWNALQPWFVKVYNQPKVFLNHKQVPVEFGSVAETIERARMISVDVSVNDESLVSFGDYPTAGIFRLILFQLPEDIPPVESLLERLPVSKLVFAYLCDAEYKRWQTVKDPSQYERAGRSHEQLPKYWDENLEGERIDISRNPGRWEIRNGKCIEAGGSPMWIGPLLGERTGGDWRGLSEFNWCEIVELENGVIRLKSWGGPFDSDQGEQRERQETLRSILFPKPSSAS